MGLFARLFGALPGVARSGVFQVVKAWSRITGDRNAPLFFGAWLRRQGVDTAEATRVVLAVQDASAAGALASQLAQETLLSRLNIPVSPFNLSSPYEATARVVGRDRSGNQMVKMITKGLPSAGVSIGEVEDQIQSIAAGDDYDFAVIDSVTFTDVSRSPTSFSQEVF